MEKVKLTQEQTERVQELEDELTYYKMATESYLDMEQQNKRYRERVSQLINYIETTDDKTDKQVHKIHVILDGLLEEFE